jgi:DNA-binding transcriptional LysR family regulator
VHSLVVGPFVAYEHGMTAVRDMFHHAIGVELRAAPSVIVADQRAVAAVACSSSCAAVIPRYVAEPMLASGELFEIHTGGERACTRTVMLVYRPGIKNSPRLRTLRAALHDAFHGQFADNALEAS